MEAFFRTKTISFDVGAFQRYCRKCIRYGRWLAALATSKLYNIKIRYIPIFIPSSRVVLRGGVNRWPLSPSHLCPMPHTGNHYSPLVGPQPWWSTGNFKRYDLKMYMRYLSSLTIGLHLCKAKAWVFNPHLWKCKIFLIFGA